MVVAFATTGDDVVLGDESADDEGVVARLALHAQHGLVAVDVERILALAAEGRGRVADAVAQPAARNAQQFDVVAVGRQVDVIVVVRHDAHVVRAVARGIVVAVRIRAEHLAELEPVGALARIQRGDGAVVVDKEAVVVRARTDQQAPVDAAVVVDPLHHVREHRPVVGIDAGLVQVGDEMFAHQEYVAGCRAIDGERVCTVVGRARILHIDDVLGLVAAGDVDHIRVGSGTAVEVDGVAHCPIGAQIGHMARPVMARGDRRQPVDDDAVLAGLAEDARVAGNADNLPQLDNVVMLSARNQDVLAGDLAFDQDARAGGVAVAGVAEDRDVILALARHIVAV